MRQRSGRRWRFEVEGGRWRLLRRKGKWRQGMRTLDCRGWRLKGKGGHGNSKGWRFWGDKGGWRLLGRGKEREGKG